MKLIILILIFGYIAFFWGIRNLFKRPLADWISLISMLIPAFSIFSMHSKNEFTMTIVNCCYVFCGFMMYFAIGSAIVFFSDVICQHKLNKRLLLATNALVSVIFLLYGYENAMNPHVHELEIELNVDREMKICFVSDVHVGHLKTRESLERLPSLINKQSPDFVIFGGDLADGPAFTWYRNLLKKTIKSINSKRGVYGVFGNHEGYCGFAESAKLYEECDIKLMRDKVLYFDEFYLVGRADSYDPSKKPLSTVIDGLQRNKPIIVVAHNPADIQEAVDLNADLQLSGHTHAGQLWPFNILVKCLYRMPTGSVLKKENTVCYISPGYGFWGLPFRIGNTPEIAVIKIKPAKR